MKDKLTTKMKSLAQWEHMPCLLYMICIIVFHTAYKCTGDDADLIANILKPTIMDELSSVVYNFNSWSSRVLVNLPIHILLHLDYKVWLVVEIFLYFVIFKTLSFIFIRENKTKNNYILFGLLMLFPFNYALTAGWITTTMTYIWPLAFSLWSCTTIKSIFEGRKYKWYHYIVFFFTTLYGSNQEQLSVILTIVFVITTMLLVKSKKITPMIIMQTIICVGNLMLHMLAPGNSNRSQVEAAARFPDYNTLSIMDKLELGFSSSLYEFFFTANFLVFFMGIIIAVLIFMKTNNWFYRLIGLVPFLSQGFFGCFCNEILEKRLHIAIFVNRMHSSGTIDEANYYSWQSYYAIVLLFAISICLIVSLYIIFGNTTKSIYAIGLLFAGLGARMVVAFSPTIWVSSNRTFIVMYFVFIGITTMLINELDWKRLGKFKYGIYGIMIPLITYYTWLQCMALEL